MLGAGVQCDFSHSCQTLTGQIQLGVPLPISMFAGAETDFGDRTAAIAFLSIGPITLTDAQGNLITGVPYLSDSGTAYLRDEVLVPEPGTWLTSVGLLLLPIIRNGRQGQP